MLMEHEKSKKALLNPSKNNELKIKYLFYLNYLNV